MMHFKKAAAVGFNDIKCFDVSMIQYHQHCRTMASISKIKLIDRYTIIRVGPEDAF